MSRWKYSVALLVLAAVPLAASAGPILDALCHRDCPRGEYCPLHYWTPGLYKLRACVHPSNLDQYPPGVDVPIVVETTRYRCPGNPPEPSRPYADPQGYYGVGELPIAPVLQR
jgi:hypothetical protein